MKNLFIDSNIWLSLYCFTNDDLEQFSKLKDIIGTDIKLFVPEQVKDEVYRNRETKIKEMLGSFEKLQFQFPAMCKNYDEYSEFYSKFKDLQSLHSIWLKKIKDDITNGTSPADIVLNDFFADGSLISTEKEAVERAVLRYNIGNPPGKDKKYGDAINWETLLASVPEGEDLFFISADRDYASVYDDKEFNPFLKREWENKKHSKIIFFKSLVDFLKKHFKEIELKTEAEKSDLIMSLGTSGSFLKTHSIIAKLSNYSDWNRRQVEDMCKAAVNNNQVSWILGDNDVNTFFMSLLELDCVKKSDDENVISLKEYFYGRQKDDDIIIDDEELPF